MTNNHQRKPLTFEALAVHVFRVLASEGQHSRSTLARLHNALGQLLMLFAPAPAESVTPSDVRTAVTVIERVTSLGRSRDALAAIRLVYAHGVRLGLVKDNPVAEVRLRRSSRTTGRRGRMLSATRPRCWPEQLAAPARSCCSVGSGSARRRPATCAGVTAPVATASAPAKPSKRRGDVASG